VLWGVVANLFYVLRATAANLVLHYEPLCGIKPYSKMCDNVSAMGHSAGFNYLPWAIAQDLVMRYGL
jgi:hypothetical protein